MIFNYVIVEDNLGALKNLQLALKSHEEFREVGVAHTLKSGIALVLSKRPTLIFLDVELGAENGFDLIKEIRQYSGIMPYVVMTTGVDKYAVKAVNADVLYFIEKPIDPDELMIALSKFEKKFYEQQKHITIKNTEGHFFMQLDDIRYMQSEVNYCNVFRENQPPMLISKTLKELEKSLPAQFVRIHKSYLINSKYLIMVNTTKKIIRINISDDVLELPIGETYLEVVKNTLLAAKS